MTEVVSPAPTRNRRAGLHRRSRIVEAARTIAATGGYDAVNMRLVAEHARVSTATLYRHFPSKHHLLVATLSKWLEHFDGGVDVDCVGLQAPFERLWFVVDALFASLSRNPLLAEAMARAYAVADATVAAQVELVRLHMTEIFADALGDDPTGRNTDIGALLADVWAANVLAVSLNRISGAELRRRLAATVRVLSTRAADGPG